MNGRRALNFRLLLSVLVAFALSMACTWFLHNSLSEKDAHALIDSTFVDVASEIHDTVNTRLVRQAMAVRERLDEDYPTDTASLQRLARELRVTEISVADDTGDIVASSVPDYLAHDGKGAFNFARAGGVAAKMMCLVNGLDTEYCQPYRANSANGAKRKFVGVWRPSGGFVEIGCDGDSLRRLARSSLVGLFENWHVNGTGGIVVTTERGLVLTDYEKPSREGMQWNEPDDSFYWQRREVDGFVTYVMIPKSSAAVQRDVLVGATAILNGAALIFVAILVAIVIAAFVRRQLREQSAKDLKMATDIQLAALPSVFPPFPHETRFDIWASMETAKEVGGDFYDFYFVGPNRVLFLIADVSGKGVSAALFMMRAKTLVKSAAQTGKPLGEVMTAANDALCENNTSNTFVTAWAGVLDIASGKVTFVNAGHNAPVVRRAGACDYLKTRPSLVLGAMPGMRYREETVELKPGDAIYLYTDGITEQPNPAQELYGEARLLKVLDDRRYVGHQSDLLKAVLADVKAHASGTEQADDCTQLVIRYCGGTAETLTKEA